MDYRHETADEARSFHARRIAFVIINNAVHFIPKGSSMSHYEYCAKLGIEKNIFNELVRGYYINGVLVTYKDNFIYDNKVIDELLNHINEIATKLKKSSFEVYFGQIVENNFELDYHYGKYECGNIIKTNPKNLKKLVKTW